MPIHARKYPASRRVRRRFTVLPSTFAGIQVFAEPHSPWQRPSNEAFNGLLRRWLPKSSNLSVYDQDDLDAISHQINTMPRRSLRWPSAHECYHRATVALTG